MRLASRYLLPLHFLYEAYSLFLIYKIYAALMHKKAGNAIYHGVARFLIMYYKP